MVVENNDKKIRSESLLRLSARQFVKNKGAMAGMVMVLIFILCAIFAPLLAPHDPLDSNLEKALQSYSWDYLLGTDEQGRDILSRIIYGCRVSLVIGVLSTIVAIVFGVGIGLIAGYFGGKLDNVLMRCMDVVVAFPGVLLAMAIVTALGPSTLNLTIAIGTASVPLFARVIRSSVLGIMEMEYIEAAEASGVSHFHSIMGHVLPNCIGPFIVLATIRVATAIMAGAGLSFLGLGAQPPTPEWGAMLATGRAYLRVAPWVATFPGLAIMYVILAFNIMGDGLRDALDPKLKID